MLLAHYSARVKWFPSRNSYIATFLGVAVVGFGSTPAAAILQLCQNLETKNIVREHDIKNLDKWMTMQYNRIEYMLYEGNLR